jgi:radical SAM protein with 4Fe4S-binding SPASM domain
MEIELFKRIIDELTSSPVEAVCLSLFGESLLHREFPDFLRIAKSRKLNVFLSTNGLQLTEELSSIIIDNSLDLLIVSYDSQNPEVYRKIRKGGELSILDRNLERFLTLKDKRLPLTILQCIDFPNTEEEVEKIRHRWRSFDVIVAMRPSHSWLGDIPEINKVVFPGEIKGIPFGICDQPWRHAVIYWDGRVGPCCNFYDAQVVLGNLWENSLADVWNSKDAENFRKKHILLSREKIKECCSCKQKSPNLLEKIGLICFDMATINTYLSATDGWRE